MQNKAPISFELRVSLFDCWVPSTAPLRCCDEYRAISSQSKGVANLSRLLNCNVPKWMDAANAVVQRIEVEREEGATF